MPGNLKKTFIIVLLVFGFVLLFSIFFKHNSDETLPTVNNQNSLSETTFEISSSLKEYKISQDDVDWVVFNQMLEYFGYGDTWTKFGLLDKQDTTIIPKKIVINFDHLSNSIDENKLSDKTYNEEELTYGIYVSYDQKKDVLTYSNLFDDSVLQTSSANMPKTLSNIVLRNLYLISRRDGISQYSEFEEILSDFKDKSLFDNRIISEDKNQFRKFVSIFKKFNKILNIEVSAQTCSGTFYCGTSIFGCHCPGTLNSCVPGQLCPGGSTCSCADECIPDTPKSCNYYVGPISCNGNVGGCVGTQCRVAGGCTWTGSTPGPTPSPTPPPTNPPGGSCDPSCGGPCGWRDGGGACAGTNNFCCARKCNSSGVCQTQFSPGGSNECFPEGSSCGTPPPSNAPNPATIRGRVYCDDPTNQATNDNINVNGARVFSYNGSESDWDTSYNIDTTSPNYTLNFGSSANPNYAIRSGIVGSSNTLYKPKAVTPHPGQCSLAHEICPFSFASGKSLTGFNFTTNIMTTGQTSQCSATGNSVDLKWNHQGNARWYRVRVFDATSSTQYMDQILSKFYLNCEDDGVCSVTLNGSTAQGDPWDDFYSISANFRYQTQIVDIDGGYHCNAPLIPFGCTSGCTTPAVPSDFTNNAPACIASPTSVTVNWTPVSEATGYEVKLNGGPGTPVSSSQYTFTADPNASQYTLQVRSLGCTNSEYSSVYTIPINSCTTGGWFQAQGGDVIATRSLLNPDVPGSQYMILNNDSGTPGVAIRDLYMSPPAAQISTTRWNADTNATSTASQYNYSYFDSRVPAAVKNDPNYTFTDASLNVGGLNSLSTTKGVVYDGYRWAKWNGSGTFTLDGSGLNTATFGSNKFVLLVEGDLVINTQVNYTPEGLFLAIVQGDITFTDNLPGAGANDSLKGFYFANNYISGASDANIDPQLQLIGSASVVQSFQLNRNHVNNNTTPSERFVFAPQDVFKFPKVFSKRNLIWREVAP